MADVVDAEDSRRTAAAKPSRGHIRVGHASHEWLGYLDGGAAELANVISMVQPSAARKGVLAGDFGKVLVDGQ
jgi:hypothetical protein